MLGHLGVNVLDLGAAKTHYDRLAPLLGFAEFLSADDQVAYRPAEDRQGLQHLAFIVRTRGAVDGVHRAVTTLINEFGGEVLCHRNRGDSTQPLRFTAVRP